MTTGRGPDPRTITLTTTNSSANVTAPAGTFEEEDPGRTVTATGIPAGAFIATVASDTAATLSAAATAAGSRTAQLGAGSPDAYGFHGWSPESDAESESYTVAAVTSGVVPPDRITNPHTAVVQRGRG